MIAATTPTENTNSQQVESHINEYQNIDPTEQKIFETLYKRAMFELTPEERLLNKGDWLLTLKQKDLIKRNIDIIYNFSGERDIIAPKQNRPKTDVGNAERLIDQYEEFLKYCHEFKSWYVWNPQEGRWKKDDTEKLVQIAIDVIRRIHVEAAKAATDKEVKLLSAWALQCECKTHITGMIDIGRTNGHIQISATVMDSDPFLINLLNGTLNLKTFELQEHDKNNNISKVIQIEYNQSATCPMWLSFLTRIFKTHPNQKEMLSFIQRAVGYTLTGSVHEQCLFLLYGSGANGKSVFLDIMKSLLGEYGGTTESATFTTARSDSSARNDIARLEGLRFVCASENSPDSRLDESLIKHLTGGEDVTARYLHQEHFTFRPAFKIWWAFNHPPAIHDMTFSIWRRIKLLSFNEVIPESEQDRNLAEKLKNELPGILNWAITGLEEYYKVGLLPPVEVKKATEEYREDQDILLQFLKENTIPEHCLPFDEMCEISATDLYQSYKTWWSYNGDSKAMSSTKFGRLLKDRGVEKERKEAGNVYKGLKLKRIN